MNLGLIVLRVVAGLLFAGHGAQKLFGSFGGHGVSGTAGFFESLGLRPGRPHALLAGGAEFFGGLLLALGLVTPLASTVLIAVMTTAIIVVHGKNGVWSSNGGFEYNLVLAAIAFAVTGVGPGAWSLDHALSLDLSGTGWALASLGAGILGGIGAVVSGRLVAARHPGAAVPTGT
jgi:putative oxidoreductase